MLKKINIILKKQRLYNFKKGFWRSYSKFKLEAKQAKAILRKYKKQLKTKLIEEKLVWITKLPGQETWSNPWNIFRWGICVHCHEEFEDQNSIMITSTLVLYVKRLSRNNQQNHIQYDHQELYCYNHDKCISHNCLIWKSMKKIVLNVNKFDKNFKTITKIEMRKTSSLSK